MEEKTAYRAKLSDDEKELLKVLRKYPKSAILSATIRSTHSIDYIPKFRSAEKLQILCGEYRKQLFIVVSKDTYPLNKCAVSVGSRKQVVKDLQSWVKQDPWIYRDLPAFYKFFLTETEGRF